MSEKKYHPPSAWDIEGGLRARSGIERGEAEWLERIFWAASDLTPDESTELFFASCTDIRGVKFWRRQELQRKGLLRNRRRTFLYQSVDLMLYGRGMWSNEPYASIREKYLPPQFRRNPLRDVQVQTAHAIPAPSDSTKRSHCASNQGGV